MAITVRQGLSLALRAAVTFIGGCVGIGVARLAAGRERFDSLEFGALLIMAGFAGGSLVAVALLASVQTARASKPAVASPELGLAPGQTPAVDSVGASEAVPLVASPDIAELAQRVRTVPAANGGGKLLLIGSFVLYLLAGNSGNTLQHVIIVTAVLAFHETGHALGMLALGYRDVKVFFLPFFGAAASGRPTQTSGWREGVVLLLGPVPGILLGLMLLVVASATQSDAWLYGAYTLITINVFNLLPIVPLDGGHLLRLTLLGRRPAAEFFLRLVSAIVLAVLAISRSSWVFGLIAFFQLASAGREARLGHVAAAWNRDSRSAVNRLEEISDDDVARINTSLDERERALAIEPRAVVIRGIVERALAARRAPGAWASVLFLVVWVGSALLGVGVLRALSGD